MKKLLLFLALAAAGLQGWADDFYIVGDATLDGWQGTRTCKMAETSSGSNIYTWTGYLKATSGDTNGFKICNGSSWSAWCASSNQKPIGTGTTEDTPQYYNDDVNPKTGSDNKWKVNTNGYYELKLDLAASTKKFTAKLLVKANASGTCLIENATDLTAFRKLVNDNGMKSLSANLTGDIDMNGVTHTPIGTDTYKYAGTFDGNGYRIKNLIITGDTHKPGLFHVCASATIKNLIMDATCTITSNNDTGGKAYGGAAFVALANTDNNSSGVLTIENCGNEATVNGTAPNKAAFVGFNYNESGTLTINISKCYNKGAISGGSDNCAFVGWNKSNSYTTTKCYNTGTIAEYHSEKNVWGRGDGTKTVTMCYGKNITGSDYNFSGNLVSISDDQVSSGELCYLLNGSSSGGTDWYQNLSPNAADANPLPFNAHKKVYQNQASPAVYSNYNLTLIDGKYQISDADNLITFSELVNAGATSSDAVLTADINMDEKDWTPIGGTDAEDDGNKSSDYKKAYKGTFDGQGHTINNLVQADNIYRNQGLFGVVTSGCTIKNLILGSNCVFKGKDYVGAFIGSSRGPRSGVVTIEKCGNEASVTGSGNNAAAFIGVVVNTGPGTIIRNCYNTGTISGGNGNGVLTGWFGDNDNVIVENFYNIGEISGNDSESKKKNALYRDNKEHKLINTYHTSAVQGATATGSMTASGELCYKLNDDQKDIVWYQTLPSDTRPYLSSSHSQVYASPATGSLKCDGTSADGSVLTYSNTESTVPAHSFSNGICSVCETLDRTYITPDENGYYGIGSVSDLEWFARIVEQVNQSANAKLTDNIATYSGSYIGNSELRSYAGIFDGQGHKITINFDRNESKIGLFRCVRNGTIKNLIIDGTIDAHSSHLMGGLVNESRESSKYSNIIVAVNMKTTHSGDGTHGGLISVAWNTPTIEKVAFVGKIDAPSDYGSCGIIGYAHGGSGVTYRNCYVTGTLNLTTTDGNDNRVFGRHDESCVNCYTTSSRSKLDGSGLFTGGGDVTSDQVKSGELCYLLNSSEDNGTDWYQDLSQEGYPIPFGTKTVAAGKWFNTSTNDVFYNEDGEGNITVYQLNMSDTQTEYNVPDDGTVTAKNVSVDRSITAGKWVGLCLPFDYAIPSGWDVRELTNVNGTGDEACMIFTAASSIEASKPYLVKTSADVPTITATDKTIVAEAHTIDRFEVNMVGRFKKASINVGDYYITNNSELKKLKDSSVDMKGFRAYFTLDDDSPVKALSFDIEDDADGISSHAPTLSEGDGVIYNVAGLRISRMQKGINIVNGKKVLF